MREGLSLHEHNSSIVGTIYVKSQKHGCRLQLIHVVNRIFKCAESIPYPTVSFTLRGKVDIGLLHCDSQYV